MLSPDRKETIFPTPDYRFEATRLETYKLFPTSANDPGKLAAAGFYYTGIRDTVKCFECRIMISDWVPFEDPLKSHKKYGPNCLFVRNIPCGNIPIKGANLPIIPPPLPGRKRNTRDNVTVTEENCLECLEAHGNVFPKPGKTNLTFRSSKKASHQEYLDYEKRYHSFQQWPDVNKPTGQSLAEAGFYFTGQGDQVMCHFCGGGLKDWISTDDPWALHAQWFPKCEFLISVKGHDFVRQWDDTLIGGPVSDETTMTDSPGYVPPPSEHFNRMKNLTVPMNRNGSDYSSDRNSIELATSPHHTYDYVDEGSAVMPKSNNKMIVDNDAEIRAIVDENLCHSCRQTNINAILNPCRHSITCVACSTTMRRCLECFTPVTRYTRISVDHDYRRKDGAILIIPYTCKTE